MCLPSSTLLSGAPEAPPEGSVLADSLESGLIGRGYSHLSVIGSGGFGTVLKAWHKASGQWYALKLIPVQLRSSETVDDNYSNWSGPEVFQRLQSIRSPKVVRYFKRWTELPKDLPAECRAVSASESTRCPVRPSADPIADVSQLTLWEQSQSTCGFEWAEAEESLHERKVEIEAKPSAKKFQSFDVVLVIQMEYCEAITLQDWISRPALRPKLVRGGVHAALELFTQLISGLADIHEAGIVHWDIKPGNVLVSKQSGQIKIFDFGLAKLLSRPKRSVPRLVQSGGLSRTAVGTPGYAPPELMTSLRSSPRGEDAAGAGSVRFELPPACPGADIFSTGVVLLELLMAGVAGDGPAWGTVMERVTMLGALREERGAALPLALLQDRGVGAWLRQLILRMLSWDAEGRPSAQDVLDELDASSWASSRHNPYVGTHHPRSPQFASMLTHLSAAHNPYIGFFLDHRLAVAQVVA